jgi:hypothetical protein
MQHGHDPRKKSTLAPLTRVGKTYIEVKARPRYLIEAVRGLDPAADRTDRARARSEAPSPADAARG